jgi:hypothetical protein
MHGPSSMTGRSRQGMEAVERDPRSESHPLESIGPPIRPQEAVRLEPARYEWREVWCRGLVSRATLWRFYRRHVEPVSGRAAPQV